MKNSNYNPYIIGICGGSGSGKTKLLTDLQALFSSEQISVLLLDNYYRPYEEQFIDENGVVNFDIPGSIDLLAFAKDVIKLKQGETISREEYTFNNPNITPKIIVTKPAPIIVVEGIFVFSEKEISQQIDLKIFVDTHDHLMMKRRIIRDAIERNYDMEDVMYRFEYHVMPAYHQYISPYKYSADIVVPNNGSTFENALKVIQSYLDSRLKDEV
ncbi:uridine kinase [Reichenbachiella agarivorans]|uniref:Uridine kinase n=1 Tax=Reichenbachiella agarivorans TaxID=2979464 RepID=A0ABY6CU83_9BACT|nr:uridine kinase [Reichenbachiella agarivorans]UXP34076.1 uridine kinase [Reichenbachiella agarivorans]